MKVSDDIVVDEGSDKVRLWVNGDKSCVETLV